MAATAVPSLFLEVYCKNVCFSSVFSENLHHRDSTSLVKIAMLKMCLTRTTKRACEIETKETLFEKLKKARANGDLEGIKQARMEYLQALQALYTGAQSAVSQPVRFKS